MDREALVELIRSGPVKVRMNNGDEYDVPNPEFASVSDLNAHVLVRDGRMRGKLLSLVCMVSTENYEPADSQ